MVRKHPESAGRAMALAAALFAITLNFLQPVVHGMLMRGDAPGALWAAICHASAADPGGKSGSAPAPAAMDHECCLGLAHAIPLVEPPTTSLPVVFTQPAALPMPLAEQHGSAGNRDGPHRLRGPPFLV